MKIEEALKEARNKLIKNEIEDSGIIARVLLQFTLKIDRNELIIKQEEKISENVKKEYENYIEKIIQGIPMQYITNAQEFYGLNFYVNENVLIPQPDTEILVENVIQIAKKENKSKILDICTGSGCIGISIAKNLENVEVTLSDISKDALEVVKKNVKEKNILNKVEIVESNMFENIKDIYDIIVSNPPYIETNTIKELSKQVQHEPIIALDGKEDGLAFYRELIKESPKYLKKDGFLCMEIGYNQKEKIINLLKNNNKLSLIKTVKDLGENDRVVICKKVG